MGVLGDRLSFGLRFAGAIAAAAATACLTVAVLESFFVMVQPAHFGGPWWREVVERFSIGLFFMFFAIPISLVGGWLGAAIFLSPVFLAAWKLKPSPAVLAAVGAVAGLAHTLLGWAAAAWLAQKPTERTLGNLEVVFGFTAITDPMMGGYKHQLPILMFAAPLGGAISGVCAFAILFRYQSRPPPVQPT